MLGAARFPEAVSFPFTVFYNVFSDDRMYSVPHAARSPEAASFSFAFNVVTPFTVFITFGCTAFG